MRRWPPTTTPRSCTPARADAPPLALTTADVRLGWTSLGQGRFAKKIGAVTLRATGNAVCIEGPRGEAAGEGRTFTQACRAAEADYNKLP